MGPLDVAQRYFDAWNLCDPSGVAAIFTDGGMYTDPATGGPLSGPAIAGYVERLLAAFPDLSFDIRRRAVGGDGVVAAVLQLQHYGIYPEVGKENFAAYIRANNRAAALPTILPAVLLLLSSLILMVQRPGFVKPHEAAAGLGLNLVALLSTFLWQRPIQGRMAESGYDDEAFAASSQPTGFGRLPIG